MNKWSRVTQFFYDWRDRLVADKSGVQTTEDTVTKRPITYLSYDNLDEITSVSVYDGDNITITSTAGVPNAPGAGLLRAYSTTFFDNQGRVYRSVAYNVDQSTGVTSPLRTTNDFYNHRGNLVDIVPTGGVATKMRYDGAGRLSVTYITNGAGTGWIGANTVTGNIVYRQQESQYDADGNVIVAIGRDRVSGETATGALGDPTTISRTVLPAHYAPAGKREFSAAWLGRGQQNRLFRCANPPESLQRARIQHKTTIKAVMGNGTFLVEKAPGTIEKAALFVKSGAAAGKMPTAYGQTTQPTWICWLQLHFTIVSAKTMAAAGLSHGFQSPGTRP